MAHVENVYWDSGIIAFLFSVFDFSESFDVNEDVKQSFEDNGYVILR